MITIKISESDYQKIKNIIDIPLWVRDTDTEEGFKELHKTQPPEIYHYNLITSRNINKVKFKYGNREFILTETLERGLVKNVTLEYDGKTENFNNPRGAVYEAEKRIKEIIDGDIK